MVAFIQKAHGCIFLYDAIEAQAAQLAISDSPFLSPRKCPRPLRLATLSTSSPTLPKQRGGGRGASPSPAVVIVAAVTARLRHRRMRQCAIVVLVIFVVVVIVVVNITVVAVIVVIIDRRRQRGGGVLTRRVWFKFY